VSKERGFSFPIAWRWTTRPTTLWGHHRHADLYVVDRTGKVAWMKRGRFSYAQLQEVIDPLLKN